MTLDDELRRRLQQAADHAGEGTDPDALGRTVAARAATGAARTGRWRGWLLLGAVGVVVGIVLGATVLRPSGDGATTDATAGAGSSVSATTTAAAATTLVAATQDATTSTTPSAPGVSSTAPATAPPTAPVTVPPSPPTTAPPTAPPTVPPTAPPDTQQPTVQASSNRAEIYDASWPECENEAIITAIATDNVGVVSVTGTWSGLAGSPKPFTKGVSNTWTMQFGAFSGLAPAFDQLIAITVTARDAAGNTRSTVVNVRVWGTCLI